MATTTRQQTAVVTPSKPKGTRTSVARSRVAARGAQAGNVKVAAASATTTPQVIPSWDTKAIAALRRRIRPFTRPAFIKAWLAAPNPCFGDLAPAEFVARGTKVDAPPVKTRVAQLAEIRRELAYTIMPEFIDQWLAKKNPYFKGAKPISLVRDGNGQRVLDMIYRLHDGVPLD